MSLYYEGSSFLLRANERSSLKNLVFGERNLKSNPTQVYALLAESIKWSSVLSSVVEKSAILSEERKLTPALALLLVHDLILSRNGVSAPKNHALRQAIERHRSRLTAEFTRARVKAGFATVAEWQASLATAAPDTTKDTKQGCNNWSHPRWIRINSLKTTLNAELKDTFANYEVAETLTEVLKALPTRKLIHIDQHVRNLVAIPHGIDLTKSGAYLSGRIIFQDKASCLPATLLDLSDTDGDVIDACAAPGNKTTHAAALHSEATESLGNPRQARIFACERDKGRAATLQKMVDKALGMSNGRLEIHCLAGQDFLKLDPLDSKFSKVGAILLDPSCSGSGIVGRDNAALVPNYELILPRSSDQVSGQESKSRKRKRATSEATHVAVEAQNGGVFIAQAEYVQEDNEQLGEKYSQRLEALSNFQSSMIEHAFRFQSAHKVVYSTCSIHAQENEHVAVRALLSSSGRQRHWRICARSEQIPSLRNWGTRGLASETADFISKQNLARGAEHDSRLIADACIRCEKATAAGTMGFFAVMFVRDKPKESTAALNGVSHNAHSAEEPEYEEWTGFSDDENS